MVNREHNIEVRFNAAIRRLVLWMAGGFLVAFLIARAVKSFI